MVGARGPTRSCGIRPTPTTARLWRVLHCVSATAQRRSTSRRVRSPPRRDANCTRRDGSTPLPALPAMSRRPEWDLTMSLERCHDPERTLAVSVPVMDPAQRRDIYSRQPDQWGADVERTEARATGSSPMVRSPRLVRPPCLVPRDWWAGRIMEGKAQPLGHPAPYDDWASQPARTQRHPRLPRRRSESRHHGNERLGRRRTRLVAQPAGGSECDGRPGRRVTFGQSTRCKGSGAVPPVGQVA